MRSFLYSSQIIKTEILFSVEHLRYFFLSNQMVRPNSVPSLYTQSSSFCWGSVGHWAFSVTALFGTGVYAHACMPGAKETGSWNIYPQRSFLIERKQGKEWEELPRIGLTIAAYFPEFV